MIQVESSMIRVIDICGSSQLTDLAGNPLSRRIPDSIKTRDNVQLIIDTVNPIYENVYFENVGGLRYVDIFGENIYLNGHDNIYFDICFNEPIHIPNISDISLSFQILHKHGVSNESARYVEGDNTSYLRFIYDVSADLRQVESSMIRVIDICASSQVTDRAGNAHISITLIMDDSTCIKSALTS
jgi:hypothetical protein